MKEYVYQVDHEYFIVEAHSLQDAMLTVAAENGVVIGEFTAFAHLFK